MPEPLLRSSPSASKIPLRERKHARTKLALLQAAVERIRDKRLDEIPVKELCDEVEISEATFFNYFPKKDDLLHYLIQVWTFEVAWNAREAVGDDAGLAYVEQVFDYTGKKLADHPRLMLEIIAHMALEPHASSPQETRCHKARTELSLAERLQAFPECEGVECVPELRLPDVLRAPLERAIETGELPKGVDLDGALLGLLGIFFGVPLWLGPHEPAGIRPAYRRQLELLWAGLRCDHR